MESDELRIVNPDGWFYDGKAWRCELWAENWPAINFYQKWHRQWNVSSGMAGVYHISLNYGVLLPLLDRLELSKDEYDDMLGCLREIESEARKHLNAA